MLGPEDNTVIRTVAAALFAFLIALGPALGQAGDSPAGVTARDRSTIHAIIESQIAAFRRDDAAAAFSYAAPTIQQKFGDAETFLAMVKQAYRPVYRPREVSFRELVFERGGLVQRVYVIGPDGSLVLAHYTMSRQRDGTWRISGCVLSVPADETT